MIPEFSLTKAEERLIAAAGTRHGRVKHGVFIAEGVRCCREAVRHCPGAIRFALLDSEFSETTAGREFEREVRRARIPLRKTLPARFRKLTNTRTPQGVLLLLERAGLPAPMDAAAGSAGADPFILILDRIADPGNLGTILRTAWAVGLKQAWIIRGSASPFAPKSIRAGMGAQFALRIREFEGPAPAAAALRRLGYGRPWVAESGGGIRCYSVQFDLRQAGLVIGNEAAGPQAWPGGRPVTVPMPGGAESLNAAQAATLLLFEGVRRGLFAGGSASP